MSVPAILDLPQGILPGCLGIRTPPDKALCWLPLSFSSSFRASGLGVKTVGDSPLGAELQTSFPCPLARDFSPTRAGVRAEGLGRGSCGWASTPSS